MNEKTFYLAALAQHQITKSYRSHGQYVAELLEPEASRRDHEQQLSEESWAWKGADMLREYRSSEGCWSSLERLASGGASNDATIRTTRRMQLMVLCDQLQIFEISKQSRPGLFAFKLPNGPIVKGSFNQGHLEFSYQNPRTNKKIKRIAEVSDENYSALVGQATYISDRKPLMARKRIRNGCLSDLYSPRL